MKTVPMITKEPDKNKSAYTQLLEDRLKKLDVIKRVDEIKTTRQRDKIELTKEQLELDEILEKGKSDMFNTPLGQLLHAASAWCIDNESSVGTEPALRSLWDEEGKDFIRKQIMKQIKKLCQEKKFTV